MMEDEQFLLELFDFYWFDRYILVKDLPPIPAPPATDHDLAATADEKLALESTLTGIRSGHRPSLSDEMAFASASDSALLALRPPKLHTIVSGKAPPEGEEEKVVAVAVARAARGGTEHEASESAGIGGNPRGGNRETRKSGFGWRRKRGTSRNSSRSLSDLQFEELKGFMDLGFDFAKEEPDPRLISIVPGLQRLTRRWSSAEEAAAAIHATAVEGDREAVVEEAAVDVDESSITRPYLSEAWDVVEEEEEEEMRKRRRSYAEDHLLKNWRIPAAADGVDMKEHLRSWAHTVASVVR